MQNILTIVGTPVGVLGATLLDPEGFEQIAKVCEKHPVFSCIVLAGWIITGVGRLLVLRSHASKSEQKALLALVDQFGIGSKKAPSRKRVVPQKEPKEEQILDA